MKKIWIIILGILFILPITGCSKKDALRFKEEYESLNNEARVLDIDKDNPFIYKTTSDIVSMIKDEDTFIVYFGFAKCPWCRSILSNLIEVASDLDINKIYYVDVLEIRDTMDIDDAGNVYKKKDADSSYYELLSLLNNVLDDYNITKNGKTYKTGEKRIYAPNIVAIKNGEAISMTTGVSSKQTDSKMDLTDEMNKESYNMIKETLESIDGLCIKGGC